MKKIILAITVICSLCCSIHSTYADEIGLTDDNDNHYTEFSDLNYDLVEISETESEIGTLYVVSDSNNDRIDIYDENGNWLASGSDITLIEVPDEIFFVRNESIEYLYSGIVPCGVADNYDYWGSWQSSDIVRLTVNFTGTLTVTVLKTLIKKAFSDKSISILDEAVGGLVSLIVGSIVNNTVIHLKGDYSYNTYCSILRKERVNRYNSNGSVMTYGTAAAHWLTSPWTYGVYPDACRYLTQLY